MSRFIAHVVLLHPACHVPEGVGYACPYLTILGVDCESDFQKPISLRDDEAKRIQGENMLNAQQNTNLVQIKDSNTKKPGRSSAVQQLNVWINKETKAALARQAKLEQRSMAAIVEELIQHSTSHEQAELVERQSLPLIREVVVTEIRKALAQHRLDLGEDMQMVILEAVKLCIRQSVEQLTRLIGRAVHIGMINRRLSRALMSHAYGEEIAAQADEDAAGMTGRQIPSRSPIKDEKGENEQR